MSPSALPPGSGVNLLQTYAEDVSSAVKIITSYCSPAPSFNPHVPNITIPSTAPLAVQHARQKLVATAAAIQSLATEPADYLPHLAIHVCPPFSLAIASSAPSPGCSYFRSMPTSTSYIYIPSLRLGPSINTLHASTGFVISTS